MDSCQQAKIDSLNIISTDTDDYSKDEEGGPDTIKCEDLTDKNVIDFEVRDNDEMSIKYDTSNALVMHGHFISKDSISTLIFIPGESGSPCGTGCNMLLIFRCNEKAILAFNELAGYISKDDVRDLDHDGVEEIFTNYEMMNMGECMGLNEIYNFKNGKKNILYEGASHSSIDCGMGDMNASSFHRGDTLSIDITSLLNGPGKDSIFSIKEIRNFSICNGGKTEQEILARKKIISDTIIVPLKTF